MVSSETIFSSDFFFRLATDHVLDLRYHNWFEKRFLLIRFGSCFFTSTGFSSALVSGAETGGFTFCFVRLCVGNRHILWFFLFNLTGSGFCSGVEAPGLIFTVSLPSSYRESFSILPLPSYRGVFLPAIFNRNRNWRILIRRFTSVLVSATTQDFSSFFVSVGFSSDLQSGRNLRIVCSFSVRFSFGDDRWFFLLLLFFRLHGICPDQRFQSVSIAVRLPIDGFDRCISWRLRLRLRHSSSRRHRAPLCLYPRLRGPVPAANSSNATTHSFRAECSQPGEA